MTIDNSDNGEALVKLLALVRRVAVELTFLVPAEEEDFNQILQRLRRSLTKTENEASLQADTHDFFQYLMSRDAAKAEVGITDIADAVRGLFAAVDLSFPPDEENFGSKTQPESTLELGGIVAAIRQLTPITEQMHKATQASANAKQGREEAEPTTQKLAKESSWLAKMVGKSQQDTNDDVIDVVQAVGPVLESVIEHIQNLDMQSERSKKVKMQLLSAESLIDIQSVMEATLLLVIDIATDINTERGHTEHFLSNVKEQLNALEKGVVGIIDVDVSIGNAEQIQSELSEQVSGIESVVSESNDLDALKSVVSERIEAITEKFTKYIDTERSQLELAQAKVGDLSSQMKAMGAEIEDLQFEVGEKQVASTTDALTGVANRGGFDQKVVEELAQSRRIKYPLSLMFIDIDKFKLVNDNYGHNAGDTVLKTVAGVIKNRLRETDYVARYGGDEFVLLLPDTEAGGAKKVAEDLVEKVRNSGFHGGGKPVDITLSIGVAQVEQEDTVETVMERADRALYRVKESGRNGVQVA